jgi:probable O-glycosylation ligase (exosortase A-associated)
MRDLILTALVFGSIPFILRNPFIGLLMWVWLGIMNPHRFTWGFAYDMPFAQIIAICTLVSILVNAKILYKFPGDRVAVLLVVFVLWLGVSPWFSFHPDREFEMWIKPIKILFMVLITLLLIGTRDHLHKLTGVLAVSVGFFGIKGGLFTIATAGNHRVWGPTGSFIQDNNALALAIIMTVPLFRYLQLHSLNPWVKRGCFAAMVLCLVAAIGSQSRGAFLALAAIGLFLVLKSRQRGSIALLTLAALPIAWWLMPESWTERMSTIQTYDEDASAMGRINAWWMSWNLAVDRFPIGGGFAITEPDVFLRYAPDPTNVLVAHSIYFQILGQHGFIGLALFLLVFGFTWLNGSWIMRTVKGRPELAWAGDLAAMCQVSLVGYAVGGAFLNLTYFDLPYYIVVILIVLRGLVRQQLQMPVSGAQTVPAK